MNLRSLSFTTSYIHSAPYPQTELYIYIYIYSMRAIYIYIYVPTYLASCLTIYIYNMWKNVTCYLYIYICWFGAQLWPWICEFPLRCGALCELQSKLLFTCLSGWYANTAFLYAALIAPKSGLGCRPRSRNAAETSYEHLYIYMKRVGKATYIKTRGAQLYIAIYI